MKLIINTGLFFLSALLRAMDMVLSPPRVHAMARDVNLKLADAGTPITSTTALAAINTEGGGFAWVHIQLGTVTDADETMSLTVECSIDGGSNYFHIGEFPGFVAADDNISISRPIYIPRPASGQTVTKVRLKARAVAGTTPSFPITSYIEPIISLAPPAMDEMLAQGLANLT